MPPDRGPILAGSGRRCRRGAYRPEGRTRCPHFVHRPERTTMPSSNRRARLATHLACPLRRTMTVWVGRVMVRSTSQVLFACPASILTGWTTTATASVASRPTDQAPALGATAATAILVALSLSPHFDWLATKRQPSRHTSGDTGTR